MLLMERSTPQKLTILTTFQRRVDRTLEEQLKVVTIGYEGEKRVDRYWKEIAGEYVLFHNFEGMNDVGGSHQIDTIFLCPQFLLVLEIKNMTGNLTIDADKHQLLRIRKTGEIDSFLNPINQVMRHQQYMKRIVERLGIQLPVCSGIIMAHQSAVIGDMPNDVPIFHVSGLAMFIQKMYQQHPRSIAPQHVELIGETLVTMHKPRDWTYPVEIGKVRKGALCGEGHVMKYKSGKFVCFCGEKGVQPLYQGLHDYRLLISEWITNKDFRDFFMIDSSDKANKLLRKLNFYYEGTNKGRRYLIPKEVWRI